MENKMGLVAGGNTGIGKATATGLDKFGVTVVMACRNKAKGEQAVLEIIKSGGNKNVEFLLVDLSSQKFVRAVVEQWTSPDIIGSYYRGKSTI